MRTPISETSLKASGRLQRGFTLIELVVVLAIAGLLIALVPVAFNKMQEGSQYRDVVRGLVTGLRKARQQALASGHDVAFQVDHEKREFGITGARQMPFPNAIEVKTTFGQLDSPATNPAVIVFLPEGGSTGGTVELVRVSGGGVRIRIDWLLGQITQQPRQP